MPQITHAFISAKADSLDTTLINPSNWNATHLIGSLIYTATDGQTIFPTTPPPLISGITWVFVNGTKRREGATYDYTLTSASVIFNSGLTAGDTVEVIP